MSEQITATETRDVIEVMVGIIPILNPQELLELMMFNQRVLDRYRKENHSKIKEEPK